jgi:hypothetical protein
MRSRGRGRSKRFRRSYRRRLKRQLRERHTIHSRIATAAQPMMILTLRRILAIGKMLMKTQEREPSPENSELERILPSI